GVEMSSTGEVACFGSTVEEAFLRSQISVGFHLPKNKKPILVTLGKWKDKVDFLTVAEKWQSLGFTFVGTAGTAHFLEENGFKCEVAHKISSNKHPNVLDYLEAGKASLVINTPNKYSHNEVSDGYLIRRKAIDHNIPLVVNLQIAKLLARSMIQVKDITALEVKAYGE
ncbi:MAG TPA: carbamoyl phosphate synthase large subunit, partial [Candidatus Gracilibacteria bacterium]